MQAQKKAETVFKEKVIADLRRLPRVWFVKIQQVAISGTPDFLICIAGHFIALEIKREKSAPITRLQEYELACVRKAGGLSFVAYPENWPTVYGELSKLALD